MTTPCTQSNEDRSLLVLRRGDRDFTNNRRRRRRRCSGDRMGGHDRRPVPPGAQRSERICAMSADPAQTTARATNRSTSATIPPTILRYLTAVIDEAGADLRPALARV